MEMKVGQYHYAKHHKNIGIWVCVLATENKTSHEFVKDVKTWDEAKEYVYKMNGWNIKK